jgi:betaine-aldehyde dehydrogenase
MRIVQEEVFGPVLTVETFKTKEEVVELANDTIYGLAGAVWSKDIEKAEFVASRLRMGTVWINTSTHILHKRLGEAISNPALAVN